MVLLFCTIQKLRVTSVTFTSISRSQVTVLCVVVAVSAGAPQGPQGPQDVQILRFDSDVQPDGYSFA